MASERKIGSNVYRCEKLPADEALPLYLRMTKFFQGAPGALASIADGSPEHGKAAFMTVCLSGDLNEGDVLKFMTDFVGTCTVSGDPCVMGVKPQTMADMVDVAWFAMEVQFRDFLVASLAAR